MTDITSPIVATDKITAATTTKREPGLRRETFRTSRMLDFCSEKELVAQTGHRPAQWPLVVLKELLDNALDACEEAGIEPEVVITVDETGIMVADNGPGLPAETVKGVLDFTVRVSSREAYVSPTRGAQGNALKTIVAMPFVLDGGRGRVEIEACGIPQSHHLRGRPRPPGAGDPPRAGPIRDQQGHGGSGAVAESGER